MQSGAARQGPAGKIEASINNARLRACRRRAAAGSRWRPTRPCQAARRRCYRSGPRGSTRASFGAGARHRSRAKSLRPVAIVGSSVEQGKRDFEQIGGQQVPEHGDAQRQHGGTDQCRRPIAQAAMNMQAKSRARGPHAPDYVALAVAGVSPVAASASPIPALCCRRAPTLTGC